MLVSSICQKLTIRIVLHKIHYPIYSIFALCMQKKRTYTNPGLQSLSLAGRILKQFFLIGFALTFFLQQFHPNFFSHNAPGFQKTSSSLLSTKQVQGMDMSALLSQEAIHSATEMEADEDDDRQNDEPELYPTGTQKYPADQLAHSYVCRVRYLQLASSVIPFFILHHSWKNHIA